MNVFEGDYMINVVIVFVVCIVVGFFGGFFVNIVVYDLGVMVFEVIVECVGVVKEEVFEIIFGQVLIVG